MSRKCYQMVTAGLLVTSLTACTSNTLVVANPPASSAARNMALVREVGAKCALPPDQKGAYATPNPTSSLSVQAVPASDERISGCASARFRLDAKGNATNIEILVESPLDKGYGDALYKSVAGSKYKPPVSSEQWYYTLVGKVYNVNVAPN